MSNLKKDENINEGQGYMRLSDFLRQQPDMTVSKIVSDWLFEPTNRFDRDALTRLKPEIVIILSYLGLIAIVFAAFNLSG